MKYYANYAEKNIYYADYPHDNSSVEVGHFDYFNLRGSANGSGDARIYLDWSKPLNRNLGFAYVLRDINENFEMNSKNRYCVLYQHSKVKLYHYSNLDLTREIHEVNPFKYSNASYANGVYFFDFFPGHSCGWLSDDNLFIGDYEGDWFKGVNEVDNSVHNAYSFIAYDFDKIQWRRPDHRDLADPMMLEYGTDKDYLNLLFSIRNYIQFGGKCENNEAISSLLKKIFYADSADLVHQLNIITHWLLAIPATDYKEEMKNNLYRVINNFNSQGVRTPLVQKLGQSEETLTKLDLFTKRG